MSHDATARTFPALVPPDPPLDAGGPAACVELSVADDGRGVDGARESAPSRFVDSRHEPGPGGPRRVLRLAKGHDPGTLRLQRRGAA